MRKRLKGKQTIQHSYGFSMNSIQQVSMGFEIGTVGLRERTSSCADPKQGVSGWRSCCIWRFGGDSAFPSKCRNNVPQNDGLRLSKDIKVENNDCHH